VADRAIVDHAHVVDTFHQNVQRAALALVGDHALDRPDRGAHRRPLR
jgi:hypothetical protein